MDIQSLIDDIDGILLIAASRPLWFKPGDPARERQVLERVRGYLVSQQQNVVSQYPKGAPPNASGDAVQQIVQSVRQEMSVLRADLLQPLQADIKVLHQQRESLLQEIRQMERSKQELDLSAQPKLAQQFISEFSSELVSHCTASLTQQLAQISEDLEMRFLAQAIVATEATGQASTRGSQEPRAIAPQERLEQLRQLQTESDRLLSTLDVNQRLIFETLQNDLRSYQDSLSQGLEKMHNLGAQGETLFTALINRLAQQLGREASTILQSSLQGSDALTKASLPSQVEPVSLPNESPKLTRDDAKTGLVLPSEQPFGKAGDAVSQATSPSIEFQALTEDNFTEHLNSEDWEIIEGLDSENSDEQGDSEASKERSRSLSQRSVDCIDTFLQLDLETSNPSAPQDLDYLLGLINEPSTPLPLSRQGELTGIEALNQAAELNIISDQRRQEIDDLYKSLFGSDSLLSSSTPQEVEDAEESAELAVPPQNAEMLPQIGSESPAEAKAVSLSDVDNLLFEGLVDPAIQSTQGQAEDWSARQSSESWDLLEENASTDLFADHQAGVQPPHLETLIEQETLTTITALTDLFEEMGISEPILLQTNVPPDNQSDAPTTQDAAPESANLVEDRYIPASPEEDLLVTDTLDGDPDREIRLDQKALRQLSDDLYSFEEGSSRSFSRPDTLDSSNVGEASSEPSSDRQALPADRFLMSDELLAEDWEEFVFPSWPNDDLTANLPETTSEQPAKSEDTAQDHGTTAASLSQELDFEPDLFPSEALELDHESWDGQIPDEYIGFEDEIVIDEMEWDQPNDGIMEEVIASPLEFGEAAKQNALQLGQDEPNPDSMTVNELPTTESQSINVPPTITENLTQTTDEDITLDLELDSPNLDSERISSPTTNQELLEADGAKLSAETGFEHPESSLPSVENTNDLNLTQPDAINSPTDQKILPEPAETKHNNHDLNG